MTFAEMYTTEKSDCISVSANGFDEFCHLKTNGEVQYRGTHGEIENVKIHSKKAPEPLG